MPSLNHILVTESEEVESILEGGEGAMTREQRDGEVTGGDLRFYLLLPLADMVHVDVAEAAWRRVGAMEEGVKDEAMGRPTHMSARSLQETRRRGH